MSELNFKKNEFIEFTLKSDVLRFGEFRTKAGRLSPYFFNAGLFTDGAKVGALGEFYANAIISSGISFDMLYGPAYKGITLAAATAIALSKFGRNVPFAFNRKEIKDHGEGGQTVGAKLEGDVLIIDDVISAGTSVRESLDIIKETEANPCGIIVSLDRQERGQGELSAIQEIERDHGLAVLSLFTLEDLIRHLSDVPEMEVHLKRMERYREDYGVTLS